MRLDPTSTAPAHGPWTGTPGTTRETLRFTWMRSASTMIPTLRALGATAAGARLRALPQEVRLAVPVLLDGADVAPVIVELVTVAEAAATCGMRIDIAPRLPVEDAGGALNTHSAARFHRRLLPVLAALKEALPRFAAFTTSPSSSSASFPSSFPSSSQAPSPGLAVLLPLAPAEGTLRNGLGVARGPLAGRAKALPGFVGGMLSSVWDARQGRRDLIELARDLRALPFEVLALTPPPLLAVDSLAGAVAQHWFLGCPDARDDDGVPLFGVAAAQCFAPLLGPIAGSHTRAEQERVVNLWAARHRERSHAIALGPLKRTSLGGGYAAASHLKQDLRAARALGFTDITIASLDGVVHGDDGTPRGDPEVNAWLDALV